MNVMSEVRDVRLLYTNAGGVVVKKLQLSDNIKNIQTHCFTKNKSSVDDFKIMGYNLSKKDREDGKI